MNVTPTTLDIHPPPDRVGGTDMETFIHTAADMKWLRETHLKRYKLARSRSAVLIGNEWGPDWIMLWSVRRPTIFDRPTVYRSLANGRYRRTSRLPPGWTFPSE